MFPGRFSGDSRPLEIKDEAQKSPPALLLKGFLDESFNSLRLHHIGSIDLPFT
jgi:hypothetical protein